MRHRLTCEQAYMNTTTYDPDTKRASIQPGSDWGLAFSSLNEYGVSPVGGRASVVGVGGFVTGGGVCYIQFELAYIARVILTTISHHSTLSTPTLVVSPATTWPISRSSSQTVTSSTPMLRRTLTSGSPLKAPLATLASSPALISVRYLFRFFIPPCRGHGTSLTQRNAIRRCRVQPALGWLSQLRCLPKRHRLRCLH